MVIGFVRLSYVSVICHVVNRRRASQKIWGGFLYAVYRQENDFELVPMVEVKTRNHIEGYFGIEFPAICNCGVMSA